MPPLSTIHSNDNQATLGTPRFACGWYETLPEPLFPCVAAGDLSFDMAVVGAGFTGLACARRLAELYPEARIALIEAKRLGAANSGRNSGFLLDISFYEHTTPEIQAAKTRLQEAGLGELNRVVTEQEIACEWQPWGNLYGALGGEDEILLDRMVERYRDAGKALEHWSAEQMAEVTGSARFARGLFHPGTVLVQPVKLIRGLAATLPQNVTLFENSPVETVVHRNGGYHLHTARSRIAVERLFLCANGGTPTLGFGKHRQLQVATFAAMTPPLVSDGPLADTAPFGLLPVLPGGATLRFTQDRRLIVRQGAAFASSGYVSDADLNRFLNEAARTLALHWPELARTAFDYAWGGIMSLTRNNAQLFGEQEPGLFVAAFCNGAGNTAGTAAGKLLAELAAGEQGDLLADQMSLPRPARLPPDFVNGFVVRHRIAQAKRRLERLYASVDHPSPGQEGRRQA